MMLGLFVLLMGLVVITCVVDVVWMLFDLIVHVGGVVVVLNGFRCGWCCYCCYS